MATSARFIILNADEAFGAELRAILLKVDGVRIAAEIDQAALLAQTIQAVPAEILLVNLDPDPGPVLTLAGEVAANQPHLAVFATSASKDGQLILDVMRKGIREFFPKPLDGEVLHEAIEKWSIRRATDVPQGKLVTVMSGCGGQGSTMLSTNLAVELADLGSRVALVDLDYRFGQVATFLDLDPGYTLGDLCNTVEQVEQSVIEKALVDHESGVRVLARPTHLNQAESLTAAQCVGVLSTLVQFNDFVLVDGPTRFDLSARSILDLADQNLLIVQLLVPSVRNTVRIIDGMREAGYNMERLHLVCNRLGRETAHLSVSDVTSTLNLDSISSIPDDSPTVGGAVNLGMSLMSYAPKSKVRMAIRELAVLIRGEEEDEEESARRGGFRLFAKR